jgi:magnesium-transporting ATPase (P-type)
MSKNKSFDLKEINNLIENKSFTLIISIFFSLYICMMNKLNFSQTLISLFLFFVIYYTIPKNITLSLFLSLFLISYINRETKNENK